MIAFNDLNNRMRCKRAARRRLGWFDHCSDSYDVQTTTCRAWRIWQRLQGVREPLLGLHGRAVPWNTYHH